MNALKLALRALLTAACLLGAVAALAQGALEIIELKHRRLDQVLPVLQPLLEPGGTLSGMNNQLFLRASARNREEIRRALAAIDTPTRQLIIRVSTQRESERTDEGAVVRGTVSTGTQSRGEVSARVWDSRSVRDEGSGQMVRAQEGSPAFIQIGRALPLPLRQVIVGPQGAIVSEQVVYHDVGRGFYALPRVQGDRVSVEISQQADSPIAHSGAVRTQQLSTTVSGRLGEWIELGGVDRESTGRSGGYRVGTQSLRDTQSIWLKVEPAD